MPHFRITWQGFDSNLQYFLLSFFKSMVCNNNTPIISSLSYFWQFMAKFFHEIFYIFFNHILSDWNSENLRMNEVILLLAALDYS